MGGRSVRHGRAPERDAKATRFVSSAAAVAAQRLERGPARVDGRLVVLVRLDVEVLPADRAQAGTVGAAEDLVGEAQPDQVARPRVEVEVALDDVLGAQLVVRAGVRRLVLAGLDVDAMPRRLRGTACTAPPPSPRSARRKTSPVDARWTTSSAGISSADSAYSWPPSENGSTDEPDGLAMLLAGSEPQPAKREPRPWCERSASRCS